MEQKDTTSKKPQRRREHGFERKMEPKDEFDHRVIELCRVTRVMAGGKRMRFRACVGIGDYKGNIGVGVAKGADVTLAVTKATNVAKRNIIHVEIVKGTILHGISAKYKAAKVLMRPAKLGKGIVAGGAMRQILELSGIPNVVGKILGSSNKINTVRATLNALQTLKKSNKREVQDEPKSKAIVGASGLVPTLQEKHKKEKIVHSAVEQHRQKALKKKIEKQGTNL